MKTTSYGAIVAQQVDSLFVNISGRMTIDELSRIRKAYELANKAHASQERKSGEPYIIHPVAVARIVGEELCLGASPVIAALLHDVAEDTPYGIEYIEANFGEDVAFLVHTLTKEKKVQYAMSKQLDNFKQMLDSIHYDIRALLIKLADRLHNMRTLSSMKPAKQMKIASETDYFYAPLANRLGLYDIKSELENLSMKFRSPKEYERIEKKIDSYMFGRRSYINQFMDPISDILKQNGIEATITPKMRSVYAISRKMESQKLSFKELEHIYIINVIFKSSKEGFSDKSIALKIYSCITDLYKERPSSLINYIDTPKENGYQSLHCQVMCKEGNWVELHISSEEMVTNGKLGCVAERSKNIEQWVCRFKDILRDIAFHGRENGFIEDVVSTFYQDDIVVFSPKGDAIVLPKGSTALDFAYEVHTNVGNYAKYARINGKLSPVTTFLKRGDRVEIGLDESITLRFEYIEKVKTYKAKKNIISTLRKLKFEQEKVPYSFCTYCRPLPGDEVVGIKIDNETIEVHKRNCPHAIILSAKSGDSIEEVILPVNDSNRYPSTISVKGVDRCGLLFELVQIISKEHKISITSLEISSEYEIFNCSIRLLASSANELMEVLNRIEQIKEVDEAKIV